MDDADVLGPFHRPGVERALPDEPGQGPDRPVDRLRPTDADRLRPGRPASGWGGRQGRCAGRSPRPHARAHGRHPGGRDEHVDDDQRHGSVAARPVCRQRGGPRRRPEGTAGDDPERHRQGVPEPRHVHLPAPTEPPADRRHDRLHGPPGAEVEPDQRLQLPPPRGRRDAGSGAGVRAGDGHRRPRRRADVRKSGRRRPADRRRSDQLLRQRRRPVRRGDVQDAGVHCDVGPDLPRALRRRRGEAPAVPLRRPGQLARPDRAAAGEQRAPHRPRGPRGDAVEGRPGPGHPAPGVERSARAAPSVGPAVVAADPADPGL